MSTLIPGLILIGLGILFLFNNKNISEGCFKFYRMIYTKKNLKVMFKACSIILIIGGLILIFLK